MVFKHLILFVFGGLGVWGYWYGSIQNSLLVVVKLLAQWIGTRGHPSHRQTQIFEEAFLEYLHVWKIPIQQLQDRITNLTLFVRNKPPRWSIRQSSHADNVYEAEPQQVEYHMTLCEQIADLDPLRKMRGGRVFPGPAGQHPCKPIRRH